MEGDLIFKILAIIGAAAWVPQVIFFAIKHYQKPKVSIYPQKEILLANWGGHLSLSFNCTLDTEPKNALITDLSVKLKHQKGSEMELRWFDMRETTQQISSPTGQIVEMFKQWNPTIIKVIPTETIHRFFVFIDMEYMEQSRKLVDELVEKVYYKSVNPDKVYIGDINQSLFELRKESTYNRLKSLYDNSLKLHEGDYEIEISAKEKSQHEMFIHRSKFHLRSKDIDLLKKNLKDFDSFVKNQLMIRFRIEEDESKKLDLKMVSLQLFK